MAPATPSPPAPPARSPRRPTSPPAPPRPRPGGPARWREHDRPPALPEPRQQLLVHLDRLPGVRNLERRADPDEVVLHVDHDQGRPVAAQLERDWGAVAHVRPEGNIRRSTPRHSRSRPTSWTRAWTPSSTTSRSVPGWVG